MRPILGRLPHGDGGVDEGRRCRGPRPATSPRSSTRPQSGYRRARRLKEVRGGRTRPAGSDESAGTYKCTNCGYELTIGSTDNLPPCPSCHNGQYHTIRGGDAAEDPYPDRKS
jgi:predicted RNA-binding Zn-ribbon protein involved in translation (DUF1610 family)